MVTEQVEAALRDHLFEQRRFAEFARKVKLSIWIIATVLALAFAWIQIGRADFVQLISRTDPELVWKLALIIYFSSWVFGTQFDTGAQEAVFIAIPTHNRWPKTSIAVLAAIMIFGLLLCWSVGDIKRFAVFLTMFVIVDYSAWRYMIKFLAPTCLRSEQFYASTQDVIGAEKLHAVVYLTQGNWKWWRLSVAVPLLSAIGLFGFCTPVRDYLVAEFVEAIPSLRVATASALISGLLVLSFVIAFETWIWILRVRTMTAMSILDDLSRRYTLKKIEVAKSRRPSQRSRRPKF